MKKFCLKWNDFHTNASKSFSTLRNEHDFYDMTLVSDDDKIVSAHKVVLSASSEFFKSILQKTDHSKPMIYLSGVDSKELNRILDYIYEGKVQIYQEDLDNFLAVAQKLKLDGLIGGIEEQSESISVGVDQLDSKEDLDNDESSSNEPTRAIKKSSTEFQKRTARIKNNIKIERTLVLPPGSNVYDESKRAVDDIVMKVGDAWMCTACNRTNKKSSEIRRHAEVHIEGLSFPCQLCGDTFRSRRLLSKHRH